MAAAATLGFAVVLCAGEWLNLDVRPHRAPAVVLTEARPLPKLRAGQVVVLDGRGESVDELMHNLYNVQQSLATSGLATAPLSQI